MSTLAIVGSPRKNGNTEILTKHTLKAIQDEGLDTELVSLYEYEIKGCTACDLCKKEERCPIKDDLFPIYNKMKQADAIIFASPVYFGSVTPEIKAVMDRAGYIAVNNGRPFERKVGGPLVVAERGGHNFTIAQIAYWFYYQGCIIPGSTDWNMAFGSKKGEVMKDKVGLETAWNFGKNVAFLVKKLKDSTE
ncbi:flavodoxin family protein [Chloroflexota bacterium]